MFKQIASNTCVTSPASRPCSDSTPGPGADKTPGRASPGAGLPCTFGPPVVVPQGDGSVLLRPGRVQTEMTPGQAAAALRVHRNTVYAYIEMGLLTERRPSPQRIMLDAAEVAALHASMRDPEYWTPGRVTELAAARARPRGTGTGPRISAHTVRSSRARTAGRGRE